MRVLTKSILCSILLLFSIPLFSTSALAESETYIIEVRTNASVKNLSIRDTSSKGQSYKALLKPGHLLKVDFSESQLALRSEDEANNRSRWRAFSNGEFEFLDHWQSFMAFEESIWGVQLEFSPAYKGKYITLYDSPGHYDWKTCKKFPENCIAWPSRSAELKFIDSKVERNIGQKSKGLYYKVGYRYNTSKGEKSGEGWASADLFKRKPTTPKFRSKAIMGLADIQSKNSETMMKEIESKPVEEILEQTDDNAAISKQAVVELKKGSIKDQ